jgi:Fis family transcriptional regulator
MIGGPPHPLRNAAKAAETTKKYHAGHACRPSSEKVTAKMTFTGEGALNRATTAFSMSAQPRHHETLHECVRKAVRQYLKDMGDHQPDDFYQVVLAQVEKPMIEEVLRWAGGNQTRTAEALGISRGTLRKKMRIHDID